MKKLLLLIVSLFVMVPVIAQEERDVEVIELDLIAGAAGSSAYLAPSGEIFAHLTGRELCIYDDEGKQLDCYELPENMRSVDTDTVRWSPDSTKLAMTEEFFRFYHEPDIHVLDVTTGEFINLTEDNIDRISISDTSPWTSLDLVPRWSPDSSKILFVRYERGEDEIITTLYTIDVESGELEVFAEDFIAGPYPITTMDWQPDLLIFNVFDMSDETQNGLWMRVDEETQSILQTGEVIYTPMMVSLSPTGDAALFMDNTFGQYAVPYDDPTSSPYHLVDLESYESRPVDENRFVTAAGWSPDGGSIIYATFDPESDEDSGVFIDGEKILEGRFTTATLMQRTPLTWAENNTVLLSRLPERNIALLKLQPR